MAQAKKPGSKASASSSPRSRRTYKAPALEKGLEILECLAAASAPMTLQQLSLALERSASEIYRMLEVLVDQGYVLREAGLLKGEGLYDVENVSVVHHVKLPM